MKDRVTLISMLKQANRTAQKALIEREGAVIAETVCNRWVVVARADLLPDELANNVAAFADIQDLLNPLDDIRVVSANQSWVADFVVVAKFANGSVVARLMWKGESGPFERQA